MADPIFLVDAFVTEKPFSGNPAAVVIRSEPAPEKWMQDVAFEMNQAETAFVWPEGSGYRLRWFTPAVEVDLCGHATLACTAALMASGREGPFEFVTKSGVLKAEAEGEVYALDFPSEMPTFVNHPKLSEMFPKALFTGANRMDWFVELTDESSVKSFEPDMKAISDLGMRGLIVCAAGTEFDVVSRFFAPQSGIGEDPVTGSAHCALAPYFAKKLDKSELTAFQASKRGGFVALGIEGDRVKLGGQCRMIISGLLG